MYLRIPYTPHVVSTTPRTTIVAALTSAVFGILLISQAVHAVNGSRVIVPANVGNIAVGGTASDAMAAQNAAVRAAAPMRAMNIANSGAIYLRGARVSAISTGSFDVVSEWGSANFRSHVATTFNTHFVGSRGEQIDKNTLQVGDVVSVTGTLDQNAPLTLLIHAQYVRLTAHAAGHN